MPVRAAFRNQSKAPGCSFGPMGEGYVRFALTIPPEKIKLAIEQIRDSGILSL